MLGEMAAISSLPFLSANPITARFRVEEFLNFSVVYFGV